MLTPVTASGLGISSDILSSCQQVQIQSYTPHMHRNDISYHTCVHTHKAHSAHYAHLTPYTHTPTTPSNHLNIHTNDGTLIQRYKCFKLLLQGIPGSRFDCLVKVSCLFLDRRELYLFCLLFQKFAQCVSFPIYHQQSNELHCFISIVLSLPPSIRT